MAMSPAGTTEETPAAQWPLMANTTTPPMGVFFWHVTEHLQSRIVGEGPQQTLPDRGRRMRECTCGALGSDHIKNIGRSIEVESGDQGSEIAIGEPMHGAGR